jgi:hypothetical protein
MPLPPVPHNTDFQVKDTTRIAQPWLQWLELLRREVIVLGESGTIAHADLTGVTPDQHHAEAHTHEGASSVSHDDLEDVSSDQHHVQAHQHNGTDDSGLVDHFGTVVATTSSGLSPYNGLSDRISRSDHSHGTPAGGGAQGLASFRQIVGSPFGDRWYAAGEIGQTNTTAVFTQNILYAVPFLSGQNTQINGIGYRNEDVTASNVRLGIYTITSLTNFYPNTLVAASAVIPTGSAAGFKSDTTFVANLQSNSLYWAVAVCSATLNQWRVSVRADTYGVLGHPVSAVAVDNHITVAFTYAALPSTFPSGAAATAVGNDPLVFLRFSA